MEAKNSYNDLPWHDAILSSLYIDRSHAGERDELRLGIIWPNGKQNTLVFNDCYEFIANMNFGIIGDETIRNAEILENDENIPAIQSKWLKLDVNLNGLKCFFIETNSTASVLNIYAKDFLLEPKK